MRIRRFAIVLGAMLMAGGAATAQPGPGPGPAAGPRRGPGIELPPPAVSADMASGAMSTELDRWISDLVAKNMFSGTILVARDGREVFAKAYGFSDRRLKTPPTVDTPFNFGSIGKVVTQTAVTQLVDAGRLQLTDTVGKWLPDYPQVATRAATIEQLLTHRGGIADFFGPQFNEAPKSQFTDNHAYYSFVSAQPPLFAPGEREQYCNGCYIVLGEIIAKASGRSYEAYVRESIFAKAGMTRTDFIPPAGAAKPYGKPRPDVELQDVSHFHGLAGSAAGGSYSTVRDLSAFDDALRSNRLTSAEGTAMVLRAKAPAPGRSTQRIGIAGGAPGLNALLIGNGEWTVVALANLDGPAAEGAASAIFRALAGPPKP